MKSFLWLVIVAFIGWVIKRMFHRFLDKTAGGRVDAIADKLFEAAYASMQKYLKTHTHAEVLTKADNDDPEAQFNLGCMYCFGEGVKQDYSEALKWFRKAAGQGLTEAQYNLALMYDNGTGVNQDKSEAAQWYRKAAEQGYSYAQNNLGVLYQNGNGVEQDEAEAEQENW